jgi:chitin synthase
MYAMCNLHDVTWYAPVTIYVICHIVDHVIRGTKGDNGSTKDLGGAKKVKGENGKEVMEVELPTAREDVDQLWSASRAALKMKPPPEKEHRDLATKQADHDRNSRTNVVIAWIGTNMYVVHVLV